MMANPVTVKYKTERIDWKSYSIDESNMRANINTSRNGRGYEFRVRIENKSQNTRLVLRGIRCQVRQQTRGDKAET